MTPRVQNSESGKFWLRQKTPEEDKNTGSDSEPMTNAKYSNMAVAAVLLKLDGISLTALKKVAPIKSARKYIRFQPVQLKNIPFFQWPGFSFPLQNISMHSLEDGYVR